ncbi:type II toxin-antitoxin system VapC family toxin [Isoptericola halotolerans]|uniref:PIN domain-containing protein n=1 Tax=Isoptericola halotolerans TaxID=300560 RepID=UPI00388EB7B7
MIGLDTDVLIRYVVRDDAEQTRLADELVDGFTTDSPGFVPVLVLVECWWVLDLAYSYPVDRRRAFVEALLASQELRVDQADTVRAALRATRDGADLADALIAVIALEAGCERVMTFDRRAARAAGMTRLA